LNKKSVAIIVAHPDDETLWSGGTILSHPSWDCFIISLCRGSDKERANKFKKASKILNATSIMGDLNDGPEQSPLSEKEIESSILSLLPSKHFDLLITHDPAGEYTQHLRHEEVSKAVIRLWQNIQISISELWLFAYEDGKKQYLPVPSKYASVIQELTKEIYLKKHSIISEIYGFSEESWEAKTCPKTEAFWKFTESYQAVKHLNNIILKLVNNLITKI